MHFLAVPCNAGKDVVVSGNQVLPALVGSQPCLPEMAGDEPPPPLGVEETNLSGQLLFPLQGMTLAPVQ